jgi:outer membrane protein
MTRVQGAFGFAAALLGTTALAAQADADPADTAPFLVPHTLQQALAQAYLTNPQLQAERANLRSVDENVPTALAGWRPTVQLTGAGTQYGENFNFAPGAITPNGTTGAAAAGAANGSPGSHYYIKPLGYQLTAQVTQPLYTGGRTTATTHQAVNKVLAERANLIATEETVLFNVVQAYVGVIADKQLLQLQINNEQVLAEQLRATQDRFKVGEITRTDVAQAESALESARAQRQSAEGTLRTADATYVQQVGSPPPDTLVDPQPLKLPVKTEQEAMVDAVENNPNVVYQLFTEASDKDAVDIAFAQVMPKLSLQGEYFKQVNQGSSGFTEEGAEGLLNLTFPLYQGGSEYAAIRQARQTEQMAHRTVDEARRTALQSSVSAWETLTSTRAAVDSDHAAIRAGFVALDGVERQAIVGTSTTLEVLQQQQTLLNAQTALVQNLTTLITASYQVAQALGRLTATDLHLDVPIYDETAYYNAVKDRLWGTNDYAVGQPGR